LSSLGNFKRDKTKVDGIYVLKVSEVFALIN